MSPVPNFEFEKSLLPPDCRFVLGIDEVGRGPWAGPVAVGGFIIDINNFDHDFFIKNKVRDSKTLSLSQRSHTFQQLKLSNYQYQVIMSSAEEIDTFGIQKTIINNMKKILRNFQGKFDFAIIDGDIKLDLPHYQSVVKADNKCFSVAAASICAKVSRDELMIEYARVYPGFDFENNMGYGTAKHLVGLKKMGITPIHRRSYKPISNNFLPNNTV
jgi:ribonuclease HII